MRLIDYLREKGETVSDFARRAQEPESTIRKIVYGQRQPSLGLAVKITALTNEAVTAEDMVINPDACGEAA